MTPLGWLSHKTSTQTNKQTNRHVHNAKYYLGLCCPFLHSVVSNVSHSIQCRPWWDCLDAPRDRGLYCLHKPKIIFAWWSPCFITKTYLYNFDPLKPHFYIVKLVFTGVYIIFLISAQNIDCGYLLEPPRQGSSNEYRVPTIYILSRNMKNIGIFYLKIFLFWW